MDIPEDIRSILGERAGPAMLAYVTPIRTSYVGQVLDEHSGTGMLLTNQHQTFCLTANHVVTPSSRVPPDSREVAQHTYCENLGRADDTGRIFLGDDLPPVPHLFKFKRKYLKSESCDLAMLDSCLSGYELPGIRRTNYYPYFNVVKANFPQIFNADIFAVYGFPSIGTISIPASREVIHLPLLHLFKGSQGANHSLDLKRYTLEYANGNPSPHGLSGAPVWLVRESNSPLAPLDVHRVRDCYKRGLPVCITSWFAGIVVSHDQAANRIQAVRPEVCAEFATKAEQSQRDIADSEEDEIIEEQLGYWKERYGHKWLLT